MPFEIGAVAPPLSDDVLAAYCPVLHLHHDDAYRPVSVEWFIERAQLNYYPNGVTGAAELHELDRVPGGVVRILAAGQVTQEKIIDAQASSLHAGNLSLTVGPEHYAGFSCDQLGDVPIYVHAKLVVDDAGCPEAYEINYMTFYAFNGHYNLLLPVNVPLLRSGHHVGDWEHLTVRLDATSLELQGVWYNAHRNIEGEWCPAEDVPRTPCGRIVGYVAINGHGIYPHCGTIPRLFFAANDRTSRRGPVWSPSRLVRLCGLAHGSGCPVVPSRGCSLRPYATSPQQTPLRPPPHPSYPPLPVARDPSAAATDLACVQPPAAEEGPRGGTHKRPECGPPLAASEPAASSPSPQAPVAVRCGGRDCGRAEAVEDDGSAGASSSAEPTDQNPQAGVEEAGESRGARCAAGEPRSSGGVDAGSAADPPPVALAPRQASSQPLLSPAPATAASEMAVPHTAVPPATPRSRAAAVGSASEHLQAVKSQSHRDAVPEPGTVPVTVQAAAEEATRVSPLSGPLTGGCDARPLGGDAGGNRRSYPLPAVVHDTSPWQRYRGFWGSVVSATEQGWFLRAEPPVSRGRLRRLFLPFAKGVERLEPNGTKARAAAALTTASLALQKLVARRVG